MTFVAEELTQELTDKYTANLQSPVYVIQSTYALDRERNIALLCFGGRGNLPKESGEGPSYYALFWDGLEVSFQAWYKAAPSETSWGKEYDVDVMQVPQALTASLDDIQQAVKDALKAYWEDLYEESMEIHATFNAVVLR